MVCDAVLETIQDYSGVETIQDFSGVETIQDYSGVETIQDYSGLGTLRHLYTSQVNLGDTITEWTSHFQNVFSESTSCYKRA